MPPWLGLYADAGADDGSERLAAAAAAVAIDVAAASGSGRETETSAETSAVEPERWPEDTETDRRGHKTETSAETSAAAAAAVDIEWTETTSVRNLGRFLESIQSQHDPAPRALPSHHAPSTTESQHGPAPEMTSSSRSLEQFLEGPHVPAVHAPWLNSSKAPWRRVGGPSSASAEDISLTAEAVMYYAKVDARVEAKAEAQTEAKVDARVEAKDQDGSDQDEEEECVDWAGSSAQKKQFSRRFGDGAEWHTGPSSQEKTQWTSSQWTSGPSSQEKTQWTPRAPPHPDDAAAGPYVSVFEQNARPSWSVQHKCPDWVDETPWLHDDRGDEDKPPDAPEVDAQPWLHDDRRDEDKPPDAPEALQALMPLAIEEAPALAEPREPLSQNRAHSEEERHRLVCEAIARDLEQDKKWANSADDNTI